MPSTITDRLNGISTSTAIKAPCRVATTANITLSGTQTIDGVAVVAGDRVLVKNQTSAVDNGIWVCGAGTWARSADFDGTFDGVGGTRVSVTSGTVNENSEWRTDGDGAIVIGTDSITWERATVNSAAYIEADDFTGSTIPDGSTVQSGMQALETAAELRLPRFADRTALAAVSTTLAAVYDAAYLWESGREGTFIWSAANNATNVTNDPGQGVYVPPTSDTTGATGAWVRKYTGAANPTWFGAAGDGTTGDSTAIERTYDFVDYAGGGDVEFTKGHLADTTINPVITNDGRTIFRGGGKLIADTGLAATVLHIRGASSDQASWNDINYQVINPVIDCSDGDSSVPGTAACTALSFNYLKTMRVVGGYLYGGEEPDNVNADSGISWVTCGEVKIDGVTIRGFNDTGMYPGGNNTTGADGDGGTGEVMNCTIQRCLNAVQAKREMKHLDFHDNIVEECTAGLSSQNITSPGNITGARRIDAANNIFRKIRANMIQLRGPTDGTIKGNVFEDWGYDYDETNSAGANAVAINFDGSVGIDVLGNSFAMVDWALDNQLVYRFSTPTFDSVTYTHGTCFGEGNSYRNTVRVFLWTDAGDAHTFINDYYEGVTGTKISTTNINSESLFTYRESGKNGVWSYRNGIRQQIGEVRLVIDTDGATLTADDARSVYTNTGAGALTTFVLPSASANEPMDVTFVNMTTFNLTVDAAAGDIIRVPGGGASTSGGTITSGARGDTVTLRAIDGTNWVPLAYGGTWTPA